MNELDVVARPRVGAPRYIIVTPVRDEAPYVLRTLESVAAQTLLPSQWVIVDDGSSDGTGAIAERFASAHPWIKVIHRHDRGHRAPGGGVVEAFAAGYAAVDEDWDYLVKLDGDVSFDRDYFERSLERLETDARLGIAGGTVCRLLQDGELRVDSVGDPPFHVRGATKIYRRACWQCISPLVAAPGWDTIDEVRANQQGWSTRTFPDLRLVQHKDTGAAEGRWRNAFKNGQANYVAGYHPLFMLAKCVKRAWRRPFLLESIALAAGYCSGYLKRLPQEAGQEAIRYLRAQQVRRLLLRPSIYG
jgi:glycosyltransferase involved in cell wall biosynthesis